MDAYTEIQPGHDLSLNQHRTQEACQLYTAGGIIHSTAYGVDNRSPLRLLSPVAPPPFLVRVTLIANHLNFLCLRVHDPKSAARADRATA
jgi:hypothetical protein